jgi:hypothetical protein
MHQSRATHHLLRSPFVFSGVRQLQREQFFVQDLLKTFKMCQNMAVMSADCQMRLACLSFILSAAVPWVSMRLLFDWPIRCGVNQPTRDSKSGLH